ncbi:MAG TPA: phosphoribosyl-ATP diphosphatase [Alphaproteobacteria bacterium]|nr:phosphoribosyl-ATP diphosphatase [Alphaproteobacteria bacterium]
MSDVLKSLYQTIQERKTADPENSYVAKLYARGPAKIAQKLGEEAVEMVIEAIRLAEKPSSAKRREALKDEAADLLFHYLVVLGQNDIKPEEILAILESRMGTSGLEEKQNRSANQ